jgi:hypothetical protein
MKPSATLRLSIPSGNTLEHESSRQLDERGASPTMKLGVARAVLEGQGGIGRGTYSSFPRTAWGVLGLAMLLAIPALKLAVMDGDYVALGPTGAFIIGCVGYACLCWAWVGEIELDSDVLRGGRRLGGAWSIKRNAILRVEPYGSEKMNTLGVTLVLRDGSRRRLPRVGPAAFRRRLLTLP